MGQNYALTVERSGVPKGHTWLPLIHYFQYQKGYRPTAGTTELKKRPIMYASHRDACILSFYSTKLTSLLERIYADESLGSNIVGYRKLGQSNFHFSAKALDFAKSTAPCVVLCYDITGFFDHIDHKILKQKLIEILKTDELPRDWYEVFRHVTKYHAVDRETLKSHPIFGPRMKSQAARPIATIRELKSEKITISPNPEAYGIPQGTPISSSFSNLYLIDVDRSIARICSESGSLYQRYSDDILVICHCGHEKNLHDNLIKLLSEHGLEVSEKKFERVMFDMHENNSFQYLGFQLGPDGAAIRSSSLSRQWRKLKRSISATRKIGAAAIAAGAANQVYTKRLRRRFSPIGVRSFSLYARRAASVLGQQKIHRQIRRLERAADRAIRDLNPKTPAT